MNMTRSAWSRPERWPVVARAPGSEGWLLLDPPTRPQPHQEVSVISPTKQSGNQTRRPLVLGPQLRAGAWEPRGHF